MRQNKDIIFIAMKILKTGDKKINNYYSLCFLLCMSRYRAILNLTILPIYLPFPNSVFSFNRFNSAFCIAFLNSAISYQAIALCQHLYSFGLII